MLPVGGVQCRLVGGLFVQRVVNVKLALQIIEMASSTYRVTYKTGAYTSGEGEGKIGWRAHYTTHRGVRLPVHRRDESADGRMHWESLWERGTRRHAL